MTMISLTPTQRLEWLLIRGEFSRAHEAIRNLLAQYEHFLGTTNAPEAKLIEKFMEKRIARSYMDDAYKFGDLVVFAARRCAHVFAADP
jgi:hypothetical protein